MIGTVTAGLVAWKHGYQWAEIQEMMFRGIRLALPAFFTNATCSEPYISFVVPSRMFANAYREKGLQSKNLVRSKMEGH